MKSLIKSEIVLFLKRIFFFFLSFLLPIIVIFCFYLYRKTDFNIKLQKFEKYEVLIMGDSQMQRLLPECFTGKALNISSPGEHYYFTYKKLQKLISAKVNQNTKILIGLSPHNFAPVYTKLFDINTPEGKKSLKSYLYFLDNDFVNFITYKNILSKEFIEAVFTYPDWGGVVRSSYHRPSDEIIQISLDMHYKTTGKVYDAYNKQSFFLNKIIELCMSNNIQLYLISTPYHSKYQIKIPSKYYVSLSNFLKCYNKSDFSYISFLDQGIEDKYFSDGNHLNKMGAVLISNKLKFIVE